MKSAGNAVTGVLHLRPEVAVETGAESAVFRFAHWKTRVPLHVVDCSKGLRALLTEGHVDTSQLDSRALEFARLLHAQGCFLPEIPRDLTCRDVLTYFQPIRSHLYAEYYAHPLWNSLRSGKASAGELVSWFLHNYHVSRSAGPIAARRATRVEHNDSGNFRKDALEEYWHCDVFYFVEGPEVTLVPETAKSYVPLPGSTAFEDLALSTAEHDWLGHLLISYFQESSIVFRSASEEFYDVVERRYHVPRMFDGWRRHMSLDADEGHADGLAEMFVDDTWVTRDQMDRSLRKVQLAHFYLASALSQIQGESQDANRAVSSRLPGVFTSAHDQPSRVDPSQHLAFVDILARASFTALAHSRKHDDIVVAGRVAERLQAVAAENGRRDHVEDPNPWVVAVGNFMVDRSESLSAFVALAGVLMGGITRDAAPLRAGLAEAAATLRSLEEVDASADHAVEKAQLNELMEWAARGVALPPMVAAVPVD